MAVTLLIHAWSKEQRSLSCPPAAAAAVGCLPGCDCQAWPPHFCSTRQGHAADNASLLWRRPGLCSATCWEMAVLLLQRLALACPGAHTVCSLLPCAGEGVCALST